MATPWVSRREANPAARWCVLRSVRRFPALGSTIIELVHTMASKFSTQPLEQGSRLLFRLLDSSVAGYSQSLRYTGVGIAAGLVGGGLFSAFLVPRHERSTSNNTLAAATGMLHEVSRNRLQWSTRTPLATPRRRGAHYRECCGGCVLRTWLHRRLLEVF